MRLAYPVEVRSSDIPGYVSFSFPDFLESGRYDTDRILLYCNAVVWLEHIIVIRMRRREDIPKPSAAKDGNSLIAPGTLLASKAAIYIAMREAGVCQSELARRIDVDRSKTHLLIDPVRSSRHATMDKAAAALGKRLVVTIEDVGGNDAE